MKIRYIIVWILLINSLFAQEFSTRYDVNVTLFENVGYADVTFKEDGKNYEIKLTANTVGVAATLLSNRVETFISKGKIINKRYVPDVFIKIKETARKSRTQTYYFNHNNKEIKLIEEKTKLVSRSSFDPSTFNITYKDFKESSKEEKMEDEYVENDSLTAYLNATINCNSKEKYYELFAVGAHNDENNVSLLYINGSEKEAAKVNFLAPINHLYNLHVEPFDKSESIVDVQVSLDEDGLLKEAFMGEVFWIGKIRAKRVYHKITHK
ncbi:MAG: DUF3108 domain-containing protein [Sulfurimonas sp.]|nr:DUF3108 domain-containing protein [Sulfurimonas sp.]